MITTPEEKRERLLLKVLTLVAEFHKRNEHQQGQCHFNLDSQPEEIRGLLLSLCRNPDKHTCLINCHWKPLNRSLVKTAGGFRFEGENNAPFIYGLTEAGWKKYKELSQMYPNLEPKPLIAMPAPVASNYDTILVQESDVSMGNKSIPRKRFKIGFSFAGEHRNVVLETINHLLNTFDKKEILYDEFLKAEFARPNLDIKLRKLYYEETELNTLWLCKEYDKKTWCGIEYRAIRQRLVEGDDDSIFLIKLDDVEIEGINYKVDGCIDIKFDPPEKIAEYIKERYALLQQKKKSPSH